MRSKKKEMADFFCAAGGASIGLAKSNYWDIKIAINHDPEAIKYHGINHPETKHYNWDIYEADEKEMARKYPNIEGFWWSAECTHLSKAKGGDTRNAKSRMLNFELPRFMKAFNKLEMVFIENVPEFESWGPLEQVRCNSREDRIKYVSRGYLIDSKGYLYKEEKDGSVIPYLKADKKRSGEYHQKWMRQIRDLGFDYEYRILNVADYGQYTSRVRYWGVAVKKGLPIKWPRQTHAKNPGMPTILNPNPLKKWKSVRDCLDLNNIGKSIFAPRKVKWSPKTLARIEYGLNKIYPCPSGEPYILRYPKKGEDLSNVLVCEPQDGNGEVGGFMLKYYNNSNHASFDEPMHTITTKDRFQGVFPQLLMYYYGRDNASSSLDRPINTITTDKSYPLLTCPMTNMHIFRRNPNPVDEPLGTIMASNSFRIYNPMVIDYNFNKGGSPIDLPLSSILSKRDKYISYVQFLEKQYNDKYNVQEIDRPLGTITLNPKFRLVSGIIVDNRIVDVYMRMLTVPELAKAQGFPDDYKWPKSSTKAKAFIGNSVPPPFACLLSECQFGAEEARVSGTKDLTHIRVA